MKTLKSKNGTKFVRVPNRKNAEIQGVKELLNKGWSFCPKSEWKEKVRDKERVVERKNKKVKKNLDTKPE
jgi:hypothetical protein